MLLWDDLYLLRVAYVDVEYVVGLVGPRVELQAEWFGDDAVAVAGAIATERDARLVLDQKRVEELVAAVGVDEVGAVDELDQFCKCDRCLAKLLTLLVLVVQPVAIGNEIGTVLEFGIVQCEGVSSCRRTTGVKPSLQVLEALSDGHGVEYGVESAGSRRWCW